MSETWGDVFKRNEAMALADLLYDDGSIDWEHLPDWSDWEDYDLYESLEEVGFSWDGFAWVD